MKNFLKIDFFLQLYCSILMLIIMFFISIFKYDLIYFMKSFVYISIIQLVSYIIRLFIKYKKTFFYYLYGVFVTPFWLYFFYEKSKFKFSYSAEMVWLTLSFYSGFIYYYLLIYYIIYCFVAFQNNSNKNN